MSDGLHLSIRATFEEAIEFARQRGITLPEVFYGLLPEQLRSRAFTVSQIAAIEQIRQIMDDLVTAMEAGQTFAEWAARVTTSTPEVLALPVGRLETIYRNAIQTHYSVGRWEQMQAVKERRPFLMYDAINDNRTRESHRALDGFIAPADDPVWDRIYTPNGHNCRCTVISLTQRQAEARGWSGSTPELPASPDEGWDYNPAKAQTEALELLLEERIRALRG